MMIIEKYNTLFSFYNPTIHTIFGIVLETKYNYYSVKV
jgi:hypothetical protein